VTESYNKPDDEEEFTGFDMTEPSNKFDDEFADFDDDEDGTLPEGITERDLYNISGEEGADINKVPIEARQKIFDLAQKDLLENDEFDDMSADEKQKYLKGLRKHFGLDAV
jgi:hypothetical protein